MMTFETLKELVANCTRVDTPDFYRRKYGLRTGGTPLAIHSWEEWHALPVITKGDLVQTPFPDRLYAPWEAIDSIAVSSGTSGSPPVYSPRTLSDGYSYRFQHHDFKKAALSSMPTPYQQDWLFKKYGLEGRLIVFDPRRHTASVRLAHSAGVDSLFLILHHLPLIAEEMKRLKMSEQIQFMEIAGEPCSQSLYRYMRSAFPNAVITSVYGSSDVETSPMGFACRPLSEKEPLEVYHANPNFFLEIANAETGAPVPIADGAEGDLLITTRAEPDAVFPLIRYKIGDMVRVVETQCPEHGSWSFQVLGRTEMEFLKVPGGILRADEVERVLRALKLSDRFEMHRYERETPEGLKTEAVLHIERVSDADESSLAETIARHLRVSAAYTYADGVRDGLYLPLRCKRLDTVSKRRKHVRMVQH